MTSRHRRRPRERVLIAGDQRDLEAIRHVLALLPEDAYGQVFIEVLDERDVVPLEAPCRVTVSWLTRVTRGSRVRPLVFAGRGEALATAVAGWVAEWMPGEEESADISLMWLGCPDSAELAMLSDALCSRVHSLQLLPGFLPGAIG